VAICGNADDGEVNGIVEFRDVRYVAGGRPVLENFNLSIHQGETVVLLGRSGSGKTTALKLVNGLIFPASGQVLVEGRPTTEWNAVELKRRIGYVIQEAGLFPHFTVAANVGIGPRLAGWPPEKVAERVGEMLAGVGLADFAQRYPRSLSGGQRQRVGVARALAARPTLLLLDEPFGALDPVTRLDLQRQFRALGETALFVTHDIREALLLATRVALLRNGRLEVEAEPREFLRSENDEARAFLEVLENVV
jgi:osmoprotectant transport system ATP-binding protein